MPANDTLLANMLSNYLTLVAGTGYLIDIQDQWFVDAAWIDQLP